MRDLFAFFVEVFWSFRGHRFVANENWWLTAANKSYAEATGTNPATSVCPFFWVALFKYPVYRISHSKNVVKNLMVAIFFFMVGLPAFGLMVASLPDIELFPAESRLPYVAVIALGQSIVLGVSIFVVGMTLDPKTGTFNFGIFKFTIRPTLQIIAAFVVVMIVMLYSAKATLILWVAMATIAAAVFAIYFVATRFFCPIVYYKSGQETD